MRCRVDGKTYVYYDKKTNEIFIRNVFYMGIETYFDGHIIYLGEL